MALRYAVDTNVLLRLSDVVDPRHRSIKAALGHLVSRGIDLCFAPQSLGEFWNTCTRPLGANGFGLSIDETELQIQSIEQTMKLLPEDERVYRVWHRLLFSHQVRGVQVHDAHLAAVLEVHEVSHLLTLNGRDFKRFPNVIAVHPQEVLVP
jgi:predicted nucleic acid-binding protein